MAHRDLGNFYKDLGDYAASLKHYTKSREFCTTSQHVLDMCLSVLEVCPGCYLEARLFINIILQLLIDQRNYSHLTTYVFKADAALDAAKAAAAPPPVAGVTAAGAAQQKKKVAGADREDVQAKLSFATALSHLGQTNYEKAANSFLNVGPPSNLGDWIGKVCYSRSSPT